MDLEEIINKWYHLLDGLPEEFKGNTAITYETAANILVGNGNLYSNGDFLITTTIPVIYRISRTGLIVKNVPHFIEKFDQFINDNIGVMEGFSYDVEAQLCSMFSDYYCEWVKNNPEINPIKYTQKHKL